MHHRFLLSMILAVAVVGRVTDLAAQVPAPGSSSGRTAGQKLTVSKPNITPLSETLVAGPLSLAFERPLPSPVYLPGLASCPPPTIRVNSAGGYAPVTWALNSGANWEFVPESRPPQTLNPAPTGFVKKPAAPSSRSIRFKSWDGGGRALGAGDAVIAVTDATGNQKVLALTGRATRACGAPAIVNASLSMPTTSAAISWLNGAIQVANFDTADNREPENLVESRVECIYPNGARLACLAAMQVRGGNSSESRIREGVYFDLRQRCAPAALCALRLPNLLGLGTIGLRLVNPYGASALMSISLTFPSRTYVETELFALPATISKTAAIVTGALDSAGQYGSSEPSCSGQPYLVWRGVTFSDPSGRAKLSRDVKVGSVVSLATMPQWEVAPGPAQFTMTVTYEVEARQPVCNALLIQ